MITKIIAGALVLALLLIIQSCSIYRVPRSIKLTNKEEHPDSKIIGIDTLLKRSDKGINILMVHGMQTHEIDDYDPVVKRIAEYLELKFVWDKRYSIGVNVLDPNLKLYEYEKDGKRIRFTFINWSPATTAYKNVIDESDAQKNRAVINRKLKQSIINDGFGDVGAMSQPDVQEKVFKVFQLALSLMLVDRDQLVDHLDGAIDLTTGEVEFNDTVVISASLGSKITLEFLSHYAALLENQASFVDRFKSEQKLYNYDGIRNQICGIEQFSPAKAAEFADSLKSVKYYWYMLSNQIVLLDGVTFNFGIDKEIETKDSVGLMNMQQQYEESLDMVSNNVCATSFFDPNDLLGFEIPSSGLRSMSTVPFNVSIPVQRFSILGLYANMKVAHTGSKEDPYVIHIIAKGWDGDSKSLPRHLTKKIEE